MSNLLLPPESSKWLQNKAAEQRPAAPVESNPVPVTPEEAVKPDFLERRLAQVKAERQGKDIKWNRIWGGLAAAATALAAFNVINHEDKPAPAPAVAEEVKPMEVQDDWEVTPVVTGQSTAWGMAAEDFDPTTQHDQHASLVKSIQEQAAQGGSAGVDNTDRILTPPN